MLNTTHPTDWAINNFKPVDAIDDHRPQREETSSYVFVDNGRGELCGIPVGYLGDLCLNKMYRDRDDNWHLSTMSTCSLYPDQLEWLLAVGEITIPFCGRTITLRLTEVK